MSVKGFFSRSYPDETLHSVLSRYHVLSANRASADTFRELGLRRFTVAASALPTNLETVCEAIGVSGEWLQELVSRYTLFPYFQPFLASGGAKRVLDTMRTGDARSIASRTGQCNAAVRSAPGLQYCVRCNVEDRNTFGVAYWHRSHQVPGALVCHRHPDQWLKVHQTDVTKTLRHELYLPPQTVAAETSLGLPDVPNAFVELAVLSHELLAAALPPLGWSEIRRTYRARLRALNLLTANGRLHQKAIHEAVLARLTPLTTKSQFQALVVRERSEHDWIANIFRSTRRGKHPIKHLIVIGWLFQNIATFVHEVESPKVAMSPSQHSGTDQPCQSINWNPSSRLHQLIQIDGLTLSEAASVLGCSVTTVRVRAQSMGIDVHTRPKRISSDLEARIRQKLLSGSPTCTVAKACGVSIATINRVARSKPAFRELMLQQREARSLRRYRGVVAKFRSVGSHPSLSTFRQAHPGAYMWLYRHDRDWLTSQFEPCTAHAQTSTLVDWPSRDEQIAARIQTEAAALAASPGKPIRISRALLLRRLQANALVEKYGNRMPKTQAALRACSQTTTQARINRIRWAADRLRLAGTPVTAWRLRRVAGLPSSTCAEINNAIDHQTRRL